MNGVELYAQVRFAVQMEGISRREAARRFGIDPRTVAKMLAFSVPSGYRRSRPPARPKLDSFTGIIDAILAADEARPKKQRHTAKRIFERLRNEHGYAGGITIVKDYVRAHRQRHREVFVPLRHDPGHAQVDFGEALAETVSGRHRVVGAPAAVSLQNRSASGRLDGLLRAGCCRLQVIGFHVVDRETQHQRCREPVARPSAVRAPHPFRV
jgi:hypothetical protein